MILSTIARVLMRWRWLVIAFWVVVGAIAFVQAPKTPELLDLRGGTLKPTEGRAADKLLTTRFARPFGEFFAVTVEGPSSFASGAARAVLDSLATSAQRQPYIQSVVSFQTRSDSLFLSKDQRTTFFLVSLSNRVTGDRANVLVRSFRSEMQRTLAVVPNRPAYQLRVTGRSALDLDIRTVSAQDGSRFELRLLPITLVILVLAFGALVAALLPLAIGILAIAISLTLVGLLATVTPMSVFVLNLTTMIGLGVGIDYSLLMVTRFREELARGHRRREAAERTLMTAGVAVLNSGLTVVVGFGALLITPMVETRSVGIGGLIVVAVAVLLCITLLPALLATMGRAIDRPKWLARRLTWYHSPQVWEKWARSLARHPGRALAVGGAIVAVLTLPIFWIRIGLPARDWWPNQTEAGAGVATLSKMGVSGYITPMRILVEVPEGKQATDAFTLRALRALSDSMRADPRVLDVRSLVDLEPRTSILAYSLLYSDLESARARHADFLDAYLSRDGRATLVDVILRDTTSLTSAMQVVERARDLARSNQIKQLRNDRVLVGGYVASSVDLQTEMLRTFPRLIALVLSATAVMLAIAFRSILVPLKAVLMNSLSVSATFGLIVLVFQHGYGATLLRLTGPTEAIFVLIPVLVFAVVFGLSMDYEVFLLSRIKEAYDRTGKNAEATMEGLSATASVISSAALVMICVFGAFAFARVLVMQFLGFGLAVAVFLDATLIRMVLVPAFMHLMGKWNWWPGGRRHIPDRADPRP